jgi:hypothetical protein
MMWLLSYRLLQVFREIAVRHDRRARVNIPLIPGLSLHFAMSLALWSIMDGRTWGKGKNIAIGVVPLSYQQEIKSWMIGTHENNRIAAAIMACSFMGVLSFTQERGAGAVKN